MPIIVSGIAPRLNTNGTVSVVLQGSGFTAKGPGGVKGDKVEIKFNGTTLSGRVEELIAGGCIAKIKAENEVVLKEAVDDDLTEITITVTAEDGSNSGTTSELGLIDP